MQAAIIPRPALWALILAVLALPGCRKPAPPPADPVAPVLAAANDQLAAGQADAAVAALESLRAGHPDNAEVLAALAFAYVQTGDNVRAAPLFERAAGLAEARRSLLVYAAGLHAGLGDHAAAVRAYRAYLQYFPNDAAAWRNLAQSLATLGPPPSALEAYREMLRLGGDQPPAARDSAAIARLYLQLADLAQAEVWWRQVLDHSADPALTAEARLGLLEIARQKQDWPDVERLLAWIDSDATTRAALAASPLAGLPAQIRQWRDEQNAAARVQRERAEAAQAAATRVLVARQRAFAEYAARVHALGLAEALTLVWGDTRGRLIAGPPLDPAVAGLVQGELRRLGDGDNAPLVAAAVPNPYAQWLSSAAFLTRPNRAPAGIAAPRPAGDEAGYDIVSSTTILAAVLTPGRPAEAVTTPALAKAATVLAAAEAASAAGDWPEAIRQYSRALGEDDTSPAVWLALGRAYRAAGRLTDAANIAQEAVRRAPDDPAYTVFLLEVLQTAGAAARYQGELRAAHEKFPGSADIAFAAAAASLAQNNPRAAVAAYRDYLAQAPAADPRRAEAETALAALPSP